MTARTQPTDVDLRVLLKLASADASPEEVNVGATVALRAMVARALAPTLALGFPLRSENYAGQVASACFVLRTLLKQR